MVLVIFIILEIMGDPFKEPTVRHHILTRLELSTLMVLSLTMWCGLMIFSSLEANDTGIVEVLTVFVVFMTVVMMVWLVGQLLRECWHEKGTSVAEMKEKVTALRRRLSSFGQARGDETNQENDGNDDNDGEGDGIDGIEMRNWSMANNPVCSL